MSVLPRAEKPYTDSYPDLDIHGELDVVFVNGGSDVNGSRNGSGLAGGTGDASSKDDESQEFRIIPHESVPFNVSGYIGGRRNTPRFRKLAHMSQIPRQTRRLDDAYAKLGYQTFTGIPEHYVRPDSNLEIYEPFVMPLAHKKPNFDVILNSSQLHVEYDLDELDLAALGLLSVKYDVQLKPEEFEVVMTMLDLCAACISVHMWIRDGENDNSNGLNDQKCMICNSASFTDSNAIIFCDGCDIAVHQDCYGVPSVPEGLWHCRRCEARREHGENYEVTCALCPFVSGAFKRTTSNRWVHMVCALWTPIIRVPMETGLLEPIQDLEHVDVMRYSLRCFVCRQKTGACIQCASRECYKAFHPMCAQLAGFYMTTCGNDMSEMLKNQDFLPVYCDKHSARARLAAEKGTTQSAVTSTATTSTTTSATTSSTVSAAATPSTTPPAVTPPAVTSPAVTPPVRTPASVPSETISADINTRNGSASAASAILNGVHPNPGGIPTNGSSRPTGTPGTSSSKPKYGVEYVRSYLREEKEKKCTPNNSLFATPRISNIYWRTPRTQTLVLPQAVVAPVQKALKDRIALDLDSMTIEFLCRYWTIKRDLRGGVMFNRRLYHAIEVAALRVIRPERHDERDDVPRKLLNMVDELLNVVNEAENPQTKKHALKQKAEPTRKSAPNRKSAPSRKPAPKPSTLKRSPKKRPLRKARGVIN